MKGALNKTIGVLIFLIAIGGCDSAKEIPAELFFRKSERTDFQISPSGEEVAFIQSHEGIKNLFLLNLRSEKTQRITQESDQDIRFAVWANDRELIFMNDRKKDDSVSLKLVNIESGETRFVLPPIKSRLRWIAPERPPFDEILIGLNVRDSSVFDIYRLNIHSGHMRMVARNPGNIVRWFADANGKLRLAMASDGLTNTILSRASENETFAPLMVQNFKTSIDPIGFSEQNNHRFYATSNVNRDKAALVEIDSRSGKEVRILFEHPEVDISDEGYLSGRMAFASYDTWRTEKHFFDKHLRTVYNDLKEKFKGYSVTFLSNDSSLNHFIIRTYTDTDPGAIYYFDFTTKEVLKLSEINPYLEPDRMSAMKPIKFFARDGQLIYGYLTMPKNAGNAKLPTIVIPHNGPSARNVWGFNTEVQYFASQGYAVLQINYRGSTGYGKKFWIAGFKQWGRDIQDDISDGTKWLIEKGIADPDRIGIYGFSFGGYSALHAACFNSDLYKCAASYSGMTNLYTYLKEIPPYYTLYLKMFYEMLGDPELDGDYFRMFSPIFNAGRVKKPVFIAQGGKDNRSNVNETNHFVKELKDNGVDVTYFLREDEGHYFRDEGNRIELYRKLSEFFSENLK